MIEDPQDEDRGDDGEEGLIDEEPEELEPDRSPEATLEAGLTEGEEPVPNENVEFEDLEDEMEQ